MTLELASFPLREAGNDPHDNPPEPFSTSKTSNWVARAGGLPPYVQHVAHALVKKGTPESEAIQKAVGIVKNWAEGKGHVHPAIKAAAAKAIAEWEAKKGKSKATPSKAKEALHEADDFHDVFVAENKARLAAIVTSLGAAKVVEALAEPSAFMLLTESEADLGPDKIGEVDLSTKGRRAMAKAKTAMPDGSFPIPNVAFLKKAIKAFGRSGNKAAAKAWIRKRASALNATSLLPSNWSSAVAESELLLLAEELSDTLALCESIAEAYSPPNWVIPKVARQPGFKPVSPPKASTSTASASSAGYDASKHPRNQGGEFLEKGHTGPAVAGVQRRLGIKTTGTYDDQTVSRIRQYQTDHGLQVDGVIGAQTAASLLGKSARAPGALPGGLRSGLKSLTPMKESEMLAERTVHTEARERDNGVKSASHSSIRSALFDLSDGSTPTHTVKLPNGTKVKTTPTASPSYGNFRRQFTVTNGSESMNASGVEEAADTAKELDSRNRPGASGIPAVSPAP